jgi:hypothetical protein
VWLGFNPSINMYPNSTGELHASFNPSINMYPNSTGEVHASFNPSIIMYPNSTGEVQNPVQKRASYTGRSSAR